MRSTAIVSILLLTLMFIPAVYAEDAQEWYTKGQNAAAVGNYAGAVTFYNNALAQDKNYAAAMSGKAVALNKMGNFSDALPVAQQALSLRATDTVALEAQAYALYSLGRWEEAVAAYDKLFQYQKNRADAFCNQGTAYMNLNKSEDASAAYAVCTRMDTNNFEAWNELGVSLLAQNRYNESISAFDHGTSRLTVTNASLWNNKGVAFLALGRYQDAWEVFKKALGVDPDYADAQANLAKATSGNGQVIQIKGTITPEVTISRIGTFFTTATPEQPVTDVTTEEIETATPATAGSTPTVAKKTTYSPESPFVVIGGFIGAMVIAAAIAGNRKD